MININFRANPAPVNTSQALHQARFGKMPKANLFDLSGPDGVVYRQDNNSYYPLDSRYGNPKLNFYA